MTVFYAKFMLLCNTCTPTSILYIPTSVTLKLASSGQVQAASFVLFVGAQVLTQCWHVGVPTWVY